MKYIIRKHILSVLSKEEKEQYDMFWSIRDKHIAHSANEFEYNHVKAYYVEGAADKGINSIGLGCDRVVGLSGNEINNIREICITLITEINSEIDSEKKKLLNITDKYTKDDILKFEMKAPKHLNDIDVSKDRK